MDWYDCHWIVNSSGNFHHSVGLVSGICAADINMKSIAEIIRVDDKYQKIACREFCKSLGLNFTYLWPKAKEKEIDCLGFLYRLDRLTKVESRIALGHEFVQIAILPF